jgi:hypothetical protein
MNANEINNQKQIAIPKDGLPNIKATYETIKISIKKTALLINRIPPV